MATCTTTTTTSAAPTSWPTLFPILSCDADSVLVSFMGTKEVCAAVGVCKMWSKENYPLVVAREEIRKEDRAAETQGYPRLLVRMVRLAGYSLVRLPKIDDQTMLNLESDCLILRADDMPLVGTQRAPLASFKDARGRLGLAAHLRIKIPGAFKVQDTEQNMMSIPYEEINIVMTMHQRYPTRLAKTSLWRSTDTGGSVLNIHDHFHKQTVTPKESCLTCTSSAAGGETEDYFLRFARLISGNDAVFKLAD